MDHGRVCMTSYFKIGQGASKRKRHERAVMIAARIKIMGNFGDTVANELTVVKKRGATRVIEISNIPRGPVISVPSPCPKHLQPLPQVPCLLI